ncbi:MAG: hypothetical protein QOE97_1769 [Pseudonocardiales bacterium]|nr:hypothetical protein [Pseudonocardiales bacterium]
MRFPKKTPFDIGVTGASAEIATAGMSQAWIINPLLKTTQFTTATGVISVAAPRAILDDFRTSVMSDR